MPPDIRLAATTISIKLIISVAKVSNFPCP